MSDAVDVKRKRFSKRRIALGLLLALVVLVGLGLAWVQHLLFDRTPGQFFDSAGTSIYYTVEGREQADPVILIHGLAAQSDINWRRPGINAMLDPVFKVVALDLRGHGLSGRPHDPSAYGVNTVEDITRLMDHLGIAKAHLAGYSLGGFIALKFAVLHPERCISVAVCASGWKNPEDPEPLRSPYRDDPEARLPPDLRKHEKMMQKALKALNGPQAAAVGRVPVMDLSEATPAGILPERYSFKEVRDFIGHWVVDREAMNALKDSLGLVAVTREQLQALQMPVICFMGTRDGLKPYATDLKAAMPQCELVLLDGADHITTVLYDDFQQGLREFFLKHRLAK
jgi:pimeloyl-ACP methyl ester carboxylesterase